MKYHFQGISFKPRNIVIEKRYITSPEKTLPKQNLEYDGTVMESVRESVNSLRDLVIKKYSK